MNSGRGPPGEVLGEHTAACACGWLMLCRAAQVWSAHTGACLSTMESGYGLSVLFAPGNRHVVLGTKVRTRAVQKPAAQHDGEAAHVGAWHQGVHSRCAPPAPHSVARPPLPPSASAPGLRLLAARKRCEAAQACWLCR